MSDFSNRLKSTLKQDQTDLNQLLSLLEEETQLLKTRESKSIEALATQKAKLVAQIEQRAKLKAKLFAQSGLGIRPGQVEPAIKKLNDEELTKLWMETREQLNLCKEKNLVNGAIISRSKQRVSRLMDIIRGKSTTQNLYGQKGKQQSFSSQQSIAKA